MYYNVTQGLYLALVTYRHCAKHFTMSYLILKIIFWVDHVRLESYEIAVFVGQNTRALAISHGSI